MSMSWEEVSCRQRPLCLGLDLSEATEDDAVVVGGERDNRVPGCEHGVGRRVQFHRAVGIGPPDDGGGVVGQQGLGEGVADQFRRRGEVDLLALEIQQFPVHHSHAGLVTGLGRDLGDDIVGLHGGDPCSHRGGQGPLPAIPYRGRCRRACPAPDRRPSVRVYAAWPGDRLRTCAVHGAPIMSPALPLETHATMPDTALPPPWRSIRKCAFAAARRIIGREIGAVTERLARSTLRASKGRTGRHHPSRQDGHPRGISTTPCDDGAAAGSDGTLRAILVCPGTAAALLVRRVRMGCHQRSEGRASDGRRPRGGRRDPHALRS